MTRKVIVGAATLAVLAAAALARSDDRAFDKKVLKDAGMGRAVYLTHCVGCHGTDARGRPTGTNQAAVPDLTLIAVRDGGFDKRHVALQIDGRLVDRRGEMPCWGKFFAGAKHSDAYAATRVYMLTSYLDFIQVPEAAPDVER